MTNHQQRHQQWFFLLLLILPNVDAFTTIRPSWNPIIGRTVTSARPSPFAVSNVPVTAISSLPINAARISKDGSPEQSKSRLSALKMRLKSVQRLLLSKSPLSRTVLLKKHAATLMVAFSLFLGQVAVHPTPACHASAATMIAPSSKIQLASTARTVEARQLDRLISDYVEKYMFSDDKFDPFEDAFREASSDAAVGGDDPLSSEMNAMLSAADSDSAPSGTEAAAAKTQSLFQTMKGIPNRIFGLGLTFCEKRLGMDRKVAKMIMAISLLVGTPVGMLYGCIAAGGVFRKFLMGQENRRYGAIKGISANEKEEVQVEAADEDEDDDDDDDDDDTDED